MCGLDARPLTLRQLAAAARARRQEEWDRTAFLASWIEAKVSGKWIHPDKLNPWRQQPARRRGPVSEAENKIAWQVLGEAMRAMGRR